jgi:hypothetical protein
MRGFCDFWGIFAIFLEFQEISNGKFPENLTSKIRDGTFFGTASFKWDRRSVHSIIRYIFFGIFAFFSEFSRLIIDLSTGQCTFNF